MRGGYGNPTPRMTGSFGSVVFPGGTSAFPGVTRSFGSVVFPGGGGPQLIVPGSITDPTFGLGLSNTIQGRGYDNRQRRYAPAVAYPVYVGGFYDSSLSYPLPAAPSQPAAPQNVTVIYPPQPPPVVVNQYGPAGGQPAGDDADFRTYQAPSREPAAADEAVAAPEQARYLLAFKDHTIYSTVAYWVEGDTIHYFTSGNKHNQASLSLIDRELTDRLNRESGVEVKLPAIK